MGLGAGEGVKVRACAPGDKAVVQGRLVQVINAASPTRWPRWRGSSV